MGKFDIQASNFKAPYGTSVFQLAKEREFAQVNQDNLNKRYEKNVVESERKLTQAEKNPTFIPEPRPGETHVICAVCREKFTDYYAHIFSDRHKKGISDNASLFA